MDKRMNDWVSNRIKTGGSINLNTIKRKEISIINNIKIFLFYRRIFFWDIIWMSIEDLFVSIKEKFNGKRRV
jgi:hypothetical protein